MRWRDYPARHRFERRTAGRYPPRAVASSGRGYSRARESSAPAGCRVCRLRGLSFATLGLNFPSIKKGLRSSQCPTRLAYKLWLNCERRCPGKSRLAYWAGVRSA